MSERDGSILHFRLMGLAVLGLWFCGLASFVMGAVNLTTWLGAVYIFVAAFSFLGLGLTLTRR